LLWDWALFFTIRNSLAPSSPSLFLSFNQLYYNNRTRTNRSVSTERTFSHTSDPTILYQICHQLSLSLAETLEKKSLEGKTLTLKLKTSNFETRSRSITLNKYWSKGEEIYTQARKLLTEEIPLDIRLMGVRMSGFKESIASDKQPLIDGYFSKTTKSQEKSDANTTPIKTSPTKNNINNNKITTFYKKIDQHDKSDKNNNTYPCNKKREVICCPICNKNLTDFALDNFNINLHIDNCLQNSNKQAKASQKTNKKRKK